jgi:hypothetical protein
VFQPFAGNASYRSLPQELIEKPPQVLRKLPCQVFVVTRSYFRPGAKGKTIHAVEDARTLEGGNITVLDSLTVPATLNLIKTCRAYVGSWSSLQQAAWLENKPVAVFYPVNYIDVQKHTAYAFGMGRDNTLGCEYPQVDAARCWRRFCGAGDSARKKPTQHLEVAGGSADVRVQILHADLVRRIDRRDERHAAHAGEDHAVITACDDEARTCDGFKRRLRTRAGEDLRLREAFCDLREQFVIIHRCAHAQPASWRATGGKLTHVVIDERVPCIDETCGNECDGLLIRFNLRLIQIGRVREKLRIITPADLLSDAHAVG